VTRGGGGKWEVGREGEGGGEGPEPGRSRLPGGGQQGADDDVVGSEACKLPARPRPAPDEKLSKSVVDARVITLISVQRSPSVS
jgi:hypothetical protein